MKEMPKSIDEIQSQKQILTAENNVFLIETNKFNSIEVLIKLNKVYERL